MEYSPIPMALVLITPLVVGILLLFLPDTPRYYIIKGDYEKAGDAIRRLRGITDERVIREEVEQMKTTHVAEQAKGKVHVFDIFKGADLRRTLLIYGLACSQVITGRAFLAQFSVYFLGQSGVSDPFLWVMITYLLSLSANAFASVLLRYLPRKKILFCGVVIEAVAMFVMAIPSSARVVSVQADRVLIAMYIIHTWIGAATSTPAASCVMSELPSQRLRPEQVGTGNLIMWGTSWLVAYTTPYFINPEQLNWGPKYAYVWGACCAILAVWVWAWVPETKGRSLEQIDELFKKKVPSRKFSTFVVETENIDEKYSRQRKAREEDDSITHVVEPVVDFKV
ncbi:hypothetical protein N0V82_006280 [Gnomoniopsis sp. IMI 355080]|nr:hypothetical protein N0V82_006280 [Gnomoniopsis sp. IMI 355080]